MKPEIISLIGEFLFLPGPFHSIGYKINSVHGKLRQRLKSFLNVISYSIYLFTHLFGFSCLNI